MSDDELFEKLEELVKLSDPDNAHFESTMKERDKLWNEVTKDIRDSLSHFLIMYTNILVDKKLIDKSSKEVFANRILSSINSCVMEDLRQVFNTKPKDDKEWMYAQRNCNELGADYFAYQGYHPPKEN